MDMSPRERLLAAISLQEPDVVPVCPLIDNHYAAYVSGAKVHEASWRHQIAAIDEIDHDAIILPDNFGEIVDHAVPSLKWKREVVETGANFRIVESSLETPYGPLISRVCEKDDCSAWTMKPPVESLEDDYEKIVWFYEQLASGRYDVKSSYADIQKKLGDRGLICARSGVELGGGIRESIIDRFRWPDLVKKIDAIAFESNKPLLEATFEAGADLVFGSSSGIGVLSPKLIEEFGLPRLRRLSDFAHKHGVLHYFHCCDKCNVMLEKFVEQGIDLMETLAPPPSGDIDLGDAKERIGDKVCLKGNINLSLLYIGTLSEIEDSVKDCITKAGRGGGFILGTEDALQWGHPIGNIKAMVMMGRKYGAYS